MAPLVDVLGVCGFAGFLEPDAVELAVGVPGDRSDGRVQHLPPPARLQRVETRRFAAPREQRRVRVDAHAEPPRLVWSARCRKGMGSGQRYPYRSGYPVVHESPCRVQQRHSCGPRNEEECTDVRSTVRASADH